MWHLHCYWHLSYIKMGTTTAWRCTSVTELVSNRLGRLGEKKLCGVLPTGTDAFCCVKGLREKLHIMFLHLDKEELWHREVRRAVHGNTRLLWWSQQSEFRWELQSLCFSHKTTHLLFWQAWVEMYFCLPVPVTISKGEYVAIVLVFPFLLFFHKLPIKTCNTLTLSMVRVLLKTQSYSDFWQNNLL